MKVKFWGVRGSIPTPGKDTVRYGGNTSCIGLDAEDGTIVIFEAGTGIRMIGSKLAAMSPVKVHLFLSHTHWDHIHGFPFFIPAYIPKNEITIYGPPHFDKNLREIMAQQMVYSYFPVNSDELQATIKYVDLKEETVEIGSLKIRSKLVNHPVTCFAYRVTEGSKSMVYTGDNEPYYNFMASAAMDEAETAEIAMIVEEQNNRNVEFVKDCDLLIADAQYKHSEYPTKVGWGHSSNVHVVDMSIKAGVKHLVMFHHEPTRSDAQVDEIVQETRAYYAGTGHTGLTISAAAEGDEIVIV
ncbi:MBL fold metallo-hydrolase [Candidatus Magnetominusculus xianensis]|uniref:MBL fold metallo-hydrolase n=1 Tax=Candidatus Magnetominusculus xianensis TaxID=1748249 RepID=A0ABR5SGW1_9BACT|nr:MBL fold metallo-hydrolase [Candidatus Magnetominusculus xianensis]KWT90922.1 MBL fold metallo-hydrolase [Candidatus Magnetominusculus xianensis]MBF0403077.1 MBL fold metallo-hydrolase [Nitrospirota bacterium]